MEGWISIERDSRDHWLWKKSKVKSQYEAWLDILMEANHKPTKVSLGNELFACDRGESLNSLPTWAKRWGWSISAVVRFLKLLETDEMVLVKNERKTTRLTVCNYALYQDVRNADEMQVKRERNASEMQVKSNNNDNNENKKEKNTSYSKEIKFSPPGLTQVTAYFQESRSTEAEANKFYNFYESKGWMVGKAKMKKWEAAAKNWLSRNSTGVNQSTERPSVGNGRIWN